MRVTHATCYFSLPNTLTPQSVLVLDITGRCLNFSHSSLSQPHVSLIQSGIISSLNHSNSPFSGRPVASSSCSIIFLSCIQNSYSKMNSWVTCSSSLSSVPCWCRRFLGTGAVFVSIVSCLATPLSLNEFSLGIPCHGKQTWQLHMSTWLGHNGQTLSQTLF